MSVVDVKNILMWVKSELEDELNNRGVWYRSGSKDSELVVLLALTNCDADAIGHRYVLEI